LFRRLLLLRRKNTTPNCWSSGLNVDAVVINILVGITVQVQTLITARPRADEIVGNQPRAVPIPCPRCNCTGILQTGCTDIRLDVIFNSSLQ